MPHEGPEQIPLILTGGHKKYPSNPKKWERPNAFKDGRISKNKKIEKEKIEDKQTDTKKEAIKGSVHITEDERQDDQPRYGR
jgi:hypothetical protein